jgi:hypothetical protein
MPWKPGALSGDPDYEIHDLLYTPDGRCVAVLECFATNPDVYYCNALTPAGEHVRLGAGAAQQAVHGHRNGREGSAERTRGLPDNQLPGGWGGGWRPCGVVDAFDRIAATVGHTSAPIKQRLLAVQDILSSLAREMTDA